MKNLQFALSAATLALAASAHAQSAAPAPAKDAKDGAALYQILPASKVLGMDVKTEANKDLGEIGDVLLDAKTGELRYAVLEVGGFLGMGEDQRVVPWAMINVACDPKDRDDCVARTTLDEAKIKAAPKLKKDARVDAELDRSIEAAFGKNDAWAYVAGGTPSFLRLSKVKGLAVTDGKGMAIGELDDVVLAPSNSCVAYLVLDTNKDAGDKKVALPFSRTQFTVNEKNDTVATTPIEAAKFANAPEYDAKDVKRMRSTPWMTELSTYYGAEPFWKSTRFANARKPERP